MEAPDLELIQLLVIQCSVLKAAMYLLVLLWALELL